MKNLIEKRREFNRVMDIKTNLYPCNIESKEALNESIMMQEEVQEYFQACKNNDIVEIADAIGDQLYLILGQAAKHGLLGCIEEIYDEIHKSNMSKIGANGTIIKDKNGKVQKPSTYVKPNIKRIIDNHTDLIKKQYELFNNEQ